MDIDDRTHKGLMKAVTQESKLFLFLTSFRELFLKQSSSEKKIPRATEKIFPVPQHCKEQDNKPGVGLTLLLILKYEHVHLMSFSKLGSTGMSTIELL